MLDGFLCMSCAAVAWHSSGSIYLWQAHVCLLNFYPRRNKTHRNTAIIRWWSSLTIMTIVVAVTKVVIVTVTHIMQVAAVSA